MYFSSPPLVSPCRWTRSSVSRDDLLKSRFKISTAVTTRLVEASQREGVFDCCKSMFSTDIKMEGVPYAASWWPLSAEWIRWQGQNRSEEEDKRATHQFIYFEFERLTERKGVELFSNDELSYHSQAGFQEIKMLTYTYKQEQREVKKATFSIKRLLGNFVS